MIRVICTFYTQDIRHPERVYSGSSRSKIISVEITRTASVLRPEIPKTVRFDSALNRRSVSHPSVNQSDGLPLASEIGDQTQSVSNRESLLEIGVDRSEALARDVLSFLLGQERLPLTIW